MTIIPQSEPIPVPGTIEWVEWQAEHIRRNKLIDCFRNADGKLYREPLQTIPEDINHKMIKKVKKKLEKELKQLRKKNEEENIKSDFYMTHEIAKISGEIKGILMIYEALEEIEKEC